MKNPSVGRSTVKKKIMERFWKKVKGTPKSEEPRHGDGDDLSETWSLPDWKELERDRIERDHRLRRIARHKRREEKKRAAVEKQMGSLQLASSNSGSEDSQHEDEEDDEEVDDRFGKAKKEKRGHWTNQCEFLLAIITMTVGMGNFYRFPFVAYQNGGGAFLIPYLIVVTLVGRPVYLMELAIGQFTSYGQVRIWDVSPLFRGVGYGTAFAAFATVSYYTAVMGQAMYYFFLSFSPRLPWTYCNPSWAGHQVCDMIDNITATNKSMSAKHVVNLPQLFFEKKVLAQAANIDHGLGPILPTQTYCLMLSWVIIFLMISKGVKSTGKAAYLTTIYPFAVIIIMLGVTMFQDGSFEGIWYFLKPDWGRMADVHVWFAALGQCFFSLSIGFGCIINYASFNPFKHNIYRDALVVSVIDTVTSIISGVIVFAALGNIAFVQNKPIEDVVADGPGLIFVVFTDAISNITYFPQVVAILCFTMLLTLASGVSVAWIGCVGVVVCDRFPRLSRFWVNAVLCTLNFLCCLIYVTPGGQFMVALVDNFGGTINIYILVVFEVIGIFWVYGVRNFTTDIEFMLNRKLNIFWKVCWGFVIPVALTVVFAYNLVTSKRLTLKGIPYPDIAIASGWPLTLVSVACVPLVAFFTLNAMNGPWKDRFVQALKPSPSYGPKSPRDRRRWLAYKQGYLLPGGAGPDTYRLLPGETPSNNNLPDWLMAQPDGTVVLVKDAQAILEPKPNGMADESQMLEVIHEIPIIEEYHHKPTPYPTTAYLQQQ